MKCKFLRVLDEARKERNIGICGEAVHQKRASCAKYLFKKVGIFYLTLTGLPTQVSLDDVIAQGDYNHRYLISKQPVNCIALKSCVLL